MINLKDYVNENVEIVDVDNMVWRGKAIDFDYAEDNEDSLIVRVPQKIIL